ncbi:hypothetical protein [Deinococcus depolymerans]
MLARRHPDRSTADLAGTLLAGMPRPGPASLNDRPLPACLQQAVMTEVDRARHWSRGGLKCASYSLDTAHLQVERQGGHVRLWTVQGTLDIPTRLGNYQRHLLSRHELRGGRVILSRAGEWYVQLQLGDRVTPPASLADTLEREGHFGQVAALLRDRPPEPRTRAQLALALLETGQTDQAELELLTALGHPPADARVHLGLSLLAGNRREPAARLDHARRGLDSAPDDFTRWWLRCSEARALVELGQAPAAQEIMRALLLDIPASELRSRARALYFAQGVAAALDDFGTQDRYAREALRLFDLLGCHGEGLSLRLDLGYRLYFQGRAEESFQMIDQVIGLTAGHGDARAGAAHLIAAELRLLSEQYREALAHLARVSEAQQRSASDRLDLPVRAFTAECQWRLEQLDWAEFECRVESLRPTQEFDQVIQAFYAGLLAFRNGQTEQARAAFERVTAGVALLDGFRLRAQAFLAYLRWDSGEPLPQASAALQRALEHLGGELALGLDADRLAPLYAACAQAGVGGRSMQRLAQRQRPLLRVRTLGGFQADVNGQVVHVRLGKARELLVYLLLHGPAGRDTLITALWDGSAREGLGSYFKQSLHALRGALRPFMPGGLDPVPHQRGQYRVSERLDVQCDAARMLGSHLHGGTADLQTLLVGYAGPFLPGVETEWAEQVRDRLEYQAQALAMTLGKNLLPQDPMAAAHAYLQATRINPLFESAWRAAEAAFEAAGHPHLARHTQETYRLALQRELGEQPARR